MKLLSLVPKNRPKAAANPISALPATRGQPPSFEAGYVLPRVSAARGTEHNTLADAAARYPRLAIAGASGSGKTSALRYLAAAHPGARLFPLRDFHPAALPHDVHADWILLDDYSTDHRAYAAELAAAHPAAHIVLAARHGASAPESFALCELEPLNDREVYSFAEPWYPAAGAGHGGYKRRNRDVESFTESVKEHAYARYLAASPIDLYLLVQTVRAGHELPDTHAQLFDRYMRHVLAKESSPEFALRALQGIALSVKRGQIAKDEHLSRGYGFLEERASGRVEFVHELVRDFMAAGALRLNPDFAPLREHLDDPAWEPVVLFYAGLGDASETVTALRERDPYLAARALAQWHDAPAELRASITRPLLDLAWDHSDPRAIQAAGELGAPEAVDWLAPKLKDKSADVRTRAAELLGQIHNDRVLEFLLPQLRDPDARVRRAVVDALGRSKSERVLEPLLVALRGDSRMVKADTDLRIAAAHALGHTGSEKAVPALLVDLQIGEPPVREAATLALEQIRSDFAVRPLREIARTAAEPDVRVAAEKVLNVIQESSR